MILQSAGCALQRENSAGERKRDAKLCAASGLAFQLDLAAVVHAGVLLVGMTQPGAAGGCGVALVDAVETLKDPALVLGRDAAAIGVRGRVYDKATIDMQLFIRHEEKKVRRAGGRTRGPAAFTSEDRARFKRNLTELLR